ncbi:MAG: universal stress protein UspA [Rhodospirillales bacterium]|nr:universal stress protein UspA [Rhodospirillales bacterium]
MAAYASVLAVLSGSDGDAAVLDAAARLAGADGRMRVLAVRSDPVRVLPVVGEAGAAAAAELVAVLEEQSRQRVARARAGFEAWRGRSGPTAADLDEVEGHPAETAATVARNADIVVVARPRNEDEPMAASLVEACLFGSGRPLLVVPPSPAAVFGASIAVFWDGSRTAARALGDALPLLRAARSVLVLTSGSLEEEVPSGEAVAQRLKAQGIAASARAAGQGDDGPALAAAAQEGGSDLIVMDGYGHSRIREMILGGVTRHMLSSAKVPILMAH